MSFEEMACVAQRVALDQDGPSAGFSFARFGFALDGIVCTTKKSHQIVVLDVLGDCGAFLLYLGLIRFDGPLNLVGETIQLLVGG